MFRHLMTIFLALVLISAAPPRDVDALLRQAAEALQRDEQNEALKLYELAAERSRDPGGVAYNLATVHYRLGHYREAQLHYRRCLEDATGWRRARALYGLGCALLQQGEDRDVELLQQACEVLRLCREMKEAPADLQADATHNLELGRLLLEEARAKQVQEKPRPPDPGGSQQPSGTRNDEKGDSQPNGGDDPTQTHPEPGKSTDPGATPRQTKMQPLPGKGKLPVLDTDRPQRLAPEDVAAYLRREVARIQRERESYELRRFPPAGNFKDW